MVSEEVDRKVEEIDHGNYGIHMVSSKTPSVGSSVQGSGCKE